MLAYRLCGIIKSLLIFHWKQGYKQGIGYSGYMSKTNLFIRRVNQQYDFKIRTYSYNRGSKYAIQINTVALRVISSKYSIRFLKINPYLLWKVTSEQSTPIYTSFISYVFIKPDLISASHFLSMCLVKQIYQLTCGFTFYRMDGILLQTCVL